MLDFVKSAFRSFFEVILWVNLILCTIFGSIVGGMINSSFGVLGFLIGIVIGLFTNIVGGGLIATILNMDNNLEQLVNTMKSGSSSGSFFSTESFRSSTLILNNKKCPFCAEEIKAEAKICPHCGKNIYEYEMELKTQEEENRKKKDAEVNEKYGNLDALFKDDNIMKEAKKIRRIYGKSVYVSHLKNKAIELGLGEIEINENDID